jgi:hypothetical protein
MTPLFDIVTPVGPNDVEHIHKQTLYTRKNVVGYRNIYIITPLKDLRVEGCIVIHEGIFPFSLQTVAEAHGANERNGWYLQQLLKLYAPFYVPGILDTFLVVDSDTFFLRPTTFIKDGVCLYNPGREHHKLYFEHMAKLHPTLMRQHEQLSGVTHHMIFEKKYIQQLFDMIESHHNHTPFWKLFLDFATDVTGAGASEYEIYFNYMLKYHPTNIRLRPLRWGNTRQFIPNIDADYISWHWHMRD